MSTDVPLKVKSNTATVDCLFRYEMCCHWRTVQYKVTSSTLRTQPADHQEGLTQTRTHQTFHRYSTQPSMNRKDTHHQALDTKNDRTQQQS